MTDAAAAVAAARKVILVNIVSESAVSVGRRGPVLPGEGIYGVRA
jgi:hypothetical protein